MSVCAGSLTKANRLYRPGRRSRKFASCVAPELSGQQEHYFQAFRRQGPNGSRPAGQGFMSTQRREYRVTPATKACRRGPRCRWRPVDCMEHAESFGLSSSASSALLTHADAIGGTAPSGFYPTCFHPSDKDPSPGTLERLATNSLQSDHRSTQLVRLVPVNIRRGSPPPRAGRRAAAVTLKSFGSSFLHIPSSSGSARFHPSLPRVPAAMNSRTERYDGKRDLHLQHAA
jgi:hypothetical protein